MLLIQMTNISVWILSRIYSTMKIFYMVIQYDLTLYWSIIGCLSISHRATLLTDFLNFGKNILVISCSILKSYNFLSTILKYIYTIQNKQTLVIVNKGDLGSLFLWTCLGLSYMNRVYFTFTQLKIKTDVSSVSL